MTARLSLAQQLAQLNDTAPVDFDPEEIHDVSANAEDVPMKDAVAGRVHYLDVGPSNLRKQHDSISDPKYDGARTSRAQVLGEEGETEEEEEYADDRREMNGIDGEEDLDDSDAEDEENDRGRRRTRRSSTFTTATIRSGPSPQTDELTAGLRKNREADVRKGKAVARQVAIWDTLLDARIRLQKSVTAAQKLADGGSVADRPECRDALVGMLDETLALSDELLAFQEKLLSKNEDVAAPARKRRRIDTPEPSVSDYADHLRGLSSDVATLEHSAHPHLIRTLNKWSSKIQAVAPSVLLPSSRNAFSKTAQPKSAVALIDETLVDHGKLLGRTRVRRGRAAVVDAKAAAADGNDEAEVQAQDPADVFDDTDFYQQLLRQVIDSRGAREGAEQDWVQAQRMRKAKKKVDTKASKGRKIRYDVHEKLQNFMVPIPMHHGWHEEQVDELFASLLGKGFEHAMPAEDTVEGVDTQKEVEALQGFRVF
ncbi:apoptosis-antagonizing transcription factor [Schizophyllum amplum]|uniref:Protein BFR2 n=1 Tax=Schizophyllum amplum TaxID=97359 RepID=A0A550CK53_9AGAR|nr:apoptosis-antagonizing transcription factor [Auriculariopsis ampla]